MGILRLLYKEHVQEHAQGSAIGGNRAAVRVSNRSGTTDAFPMRCWSKAIPTWGPFHAYGGYWNVRSSMIGKGKNAA